MNIGCLGVSPNALARFRDLADAALLRAGRGLLQEAGDSSPDFEFIYTETHLSLLLYLLYRLDGHDPKRLEQSASRLVLWQRLAIAPTSFNAMAVTLMGVLLRADEDAFALQGPIATLLNSRSDASQRIWNLSCG